MHLKGPVGSTCQLRDAQGRILIQLTIDAGQQELEVDHLAAGTYLLCFYHPSSGSKQVRVQVR